MMLTGNLWKNILLYSLPLVLTNLLQLLFNIADVAIVGKFAGSLSLGAVGSTTLLISLTTGWLIGMSSGVNAVVAYFVGAKNSDKEKASIYTGLIICLITGIFTFLVGFFLARPVLTLMGTKDELIDEAVLYFQIYMIGSPALALFNYGNGVLSAEGNTKEPLVYLAISGVINVGLNLVFVLGFKMTADGVAYASIISQYISMILVLIAMMRTNKSYKLNFKEFKLDKSCALRILRIGIPSALQYSLFAIANLFVQSAVNVFDHIVVEGNSAAMNLDSVVYEIMAAFYVATTSFVAQNYGANNQERIKKSYLVTTVYSFGIALLLGSVFFIFPRQLLSIFTNDKEVIDAGVIRLRILAFSYCLSAFMDNATACCRGLGKTRVPTAILLLCTIVFRVTWIYTIFAYFKTLESLYLLYCCAFTLAGILENIYLYFVYKKIYKKKEVLVNEPSIK